ncbi:MAG: hypothetical protein Q8P67_19740 [archaeon]|nr:hypothetical protein [archaeon]
MTDILANALLSDPQCEAVLLDLGHRVHAGFLQRRLLARACLQGESARPLLERLHIFHCGDSLQLAATLRTSLPRLLEARRGRVRLLCMDHLASSFWQDRHEASLLPSSARAHSLSRIPFPLLRALLQRHSCALVAAKPAFFCPQPSSLSSASELLSRSHREYLPAAWSSLVTHRISLCRLGCAVPSPGQPFETRVRLLLSHPNSSSTAPISSTTTSTSSQEQSALVHPPSHLLLRISDAGCQIGLWSSEP